MCKLEPITTNVVSSNSTHSEVYAIQLYVMKLVSKVGRWFSPDTLVSSTNKTDRHEVTEIFLKVVLNIIAITHSDTFRATLFAIQKYNKENE